VVGEVCIIQIRIDDFGQTIQGIEGLIRLAGQ